MHIGSRHRRVRLLRQGSTTSGREAPCRTDIHADSHTCLGPAEKLAGHVGLGDADERKWFRVGQAPADVLHAHAGVDHHRHGGQLEQRKGKGKELDARWHHHGHAGAGSDTALSHPIRILVGEPVQFRKRDRTMRSATMHLDSTNGLVHSHAVGLRLLLEVMGDVPAHAVEDTNCRMRSMASAGASSSR